MGGKTVILMASPSKRRKGGGRKPKYTGEFLIVLRKIWAFFSYRCGKILSPFMREQTGFLEQPFHITDKDKELLLSISPSTIDRLLKADKKKLALKGKSGTKPGKLLKKQIPVRTYYAEADKKPGFFEIDTVHHCGTSDSGEFCLTLTATDVYSGWTELRPTLNKAHKWVFKALLDIKSSLPFPLMGIARTLVRATTAVSLSMPPCSNGAVMSVSSLPDRGLTVRTTIALSIRKTSPGSETS
ncbi:MAG: hypothetical protein LBB81_07455 [Treponema sp.]|jgi:hypothetical protein|nr:hypothetical protein [Treponema sp.]